MAEHFNKNLMATLFKICDNSICKATFIVPLGIENKQNLKPCLLIHLCLVKLNGKEKIFLISASFDPPDWLPHRTDVHPLHRLRGPGLDVALHPLGVRPRPGGDG